MITISLKKSVYLVMFLLSTFFFISCEQDNPEVVNEDELITTVEVTLKSNSQTIVLKSTDLDGDGPSDQEIEVIGGPFTKNTVYTGTVTFLNESVNPSINISDEVLAEAEEHQLFFQAPAAFGTFVYDDADADEKPLGLEFTLTTGSTAISGNLTVILKHEPNKSALGVSSGNIENAGGSTDVQVIFPIQILSDVLVK
jgi:hypothetical protein